MSYTGIASTTWRTPALLLCWLAFSASTMACVAKENDTAFSRFLEADAPPNDASTRIEFGHGRLPKDFPAGLPVPAHASLLGWVRNSSDTAYSWEAVYEVAGDTGQVTGAIGDGLKSGGWQVTDRAVRNGYQSLNVSGGDQHANRTGVIAIGPATRPGRVQVIEEIGQDR